MGWRNNTLHEIFLFVAMWVSWPHFFGCFAAQSSPNGADLVLIWVAMSWDFEGLWYITSNLIAMAWWPPIYKRWPPTKKERPPISKRAQVSQVCKSYCNIISTVSRSWRNHSQNVKGRLLAIASRPSLLGWRRSCQLVHCSNRPLEFTLVVACSVCFVYFLTF